MGVGCMMRVLRALVAATCYPHPELSNRYLIASIHRPALVHKAAASTLSKNRVQVLALASFPGFLIVFLSRLFLSRLFLSWLFLSRSRHPAHTLTRPEHTTNKVSPFAFTVSNWLEQLLKK